MVAGTAEAVTDRAGEQLARSLKSRHVAMITFGGIIGAGLFVGSSTAISTIGPAVVFSYALAGLLVLLVMRMIAEMAMAMPGVQTFADFAREGIGPWAGYMVGWLYWWFWIVVIPIEAIAGAKIIMAWLEGLGLPGLEVWQVGVPIMAVLTAVNLLSARSYAEFEFWFASTKVVAIAVFILVAGLHAFGITSPSGSTLSNLTAHGGFAPAGVAAVLAGVTTTIFSMCGAEIATLAAAESEEGTRSIARLTMSVAVRILVFFVFSIFLITAIVPWNTVEPGLSPFAMALRTMGYGNADLVMDAIVLVAVLSCLNSGFYITSRAMFGLARQGDAPQACVRLSRSRVPARSILIASLFSYLALAASVLSPDLVFNFLLNSAGAIMLFIYLLIAVSQLKLRARFEREAPGQLQLKMWLHPWGTLIAIAGMVAVLVVMLADPVRRYEFLASFAVAVGFFVAWWLLRRRQTAITILSATSKE
jgi:L-asparagine transporter-like permease